MCSHIGRTLPMEIKMIMNLSTDEGFSAAKLTLIVNYWCLTGKICWIQAYLNLTGPKLGEISLVGLELNTRHTPNADRFCVYILEVCLFVTLCHFVSVPNFLSLRLCSGAAAEWICFSSSRCVSFHRLRCVPTLSQLQRSGALRGRYAGLLFLPDGGAQRGNLAQSRWDRKLGTETKLNIRWIFKIKNSVLTTDHISLYYTNKTS